MERRTLLRLGASTIAATILSGCAPEIPTPTPTTKPTILTPENPLFTELLKPESAVSLRKKLDALPDSPYKTFALDTLGIILQEQSPAKITLTGVDIPNHGLTVSTVVWNDRGMYGQAGIRDPKRVPFSQAAIDEYYMLIPHLLAGKGLVEVKVDLTQNKDFASGIAPNIVLNIPPSNALEPKFSENILLTKDFILVKELFSLAFMIKHVEESIKAHQQNSKYPIYLQVNSSSPKTEVISHGFCQVQNNKGRAVVLADLGAIIMVFKAHQMQKGGLDLTRYSSNPKEQAQIDLILNSNFDTDPDKLLPSIADFIHQNITRLQGLGRFSGNYNKIP